MRGWRPVASVAALGATAAVGIFLPRVLGSTWADIGAQLGNIGLLALVGVAALWLGGLACYTVAMVASLPGLSLRRALALNLAGSSAANLMPFGGVVGTGMNLAMVRSWRLPTRSFASSVAVLNLVNILGKLALPVVAGLIVAHDLGTSSVIGASALWLGGALAGVVGLVAVALGRGSWSVALDRGLARLRRSTPVAVRRAVELGVTESSAGERGVGEPGVSEPGPVERLRTDVRSVLRHGWRPLVLGMGGYLALQFALFALCLHLAGLGSAVGIGAVFAAFATERAVTLAVVTPAGAGLAEASAAGLLVALGAPPVAAAAGVVLYRLFVFAAEIPVGVAVFAGWALRRLGQRPA